MQTAILAPAAVLIMWSMVIVIWVALTRLPAMRKAGLTFGAVPPGAQYKNAEPMMPEKVNWVSHNYTHLMEQPTLFYAVVAVLALAGAGTGANVTLAWLYVGLRIVHSLWQILVNTLAVRLILFLLSTIVLFLLAINALQATLL